MTDLLRLDAQCPVCGEPPPVRPSPRECEEKKAWPPNDTVQTVQCIACKMRRRKVIYPIPAIAYVRAS